MDTIVQSLNGWTVLFIGAITMVGTERIVEEFLSVSGAAEAALTGVVALVLLYAQLAVAYYGRRLLR